MYSSPASTDPTIAGLLRGLIHELRNPLSAIITASNLLASNRMVDEESTMLLEVVQKESYRMNHILTEFSAYIKPPAPRAEAFDLAATARQTVTQLLEDRGLKSAIVFQDELPNELPACGDVVQVERALCKVAANACEALSKGGTIRLAGGVTETCAWINIDDSGEGLSTAARDHAFEPFFSTKAQAVGLGLAIAQSGIESSGGAITLSPLDTGTRVHIELPAGK